MFEGRWDRGDAAGDGAGLLCDYSLFSGGLAEVEAEDRIGEALTNGAELAELDREVPGLAG